MTDKLIKSTGTVGGMTLLSRVLGFLRDAVIAWLFGASMGLDAFLLAFRIPNFLRRLFAEGAFASAFVPVLTEYKTNRSKEEVQLLINRVAGNLTLILVLVTAIGMIAAPWFILAFAPGFKQDATKFELAASMLRITFPYIFLISITAFFGGILNTYRRFAVPAFTPVLLNISMIVTALVLSPFTNHPVESLAWGVVLGGVLQLGFQIPFLKKLGFLPRLSINWHDSGVRRILKLMSPAILGASAMQINLLVDNIFASFLPVGSLSWLYFSDRLLELPIGIFGVALATVVLPHLSEKYASQSHQAYSASIDWALRWVLLVSVPATVGLVVLSGPILSTLFQYGHFESSDVLMAQRSLIALSLGLVCFIAIKVLVSAFYARQNTSFPVKIAMIAIVANVIFNAIFIGPLAHAGLALSSSLASFLNVGILLIVLIKRKYYEPHMGWGKYILQMIAANGLMGLFVWYFSPGLDTWFEWAALDRVLRLSLLIGGAGAVYFVTLWGTGLRIKHLTLQHA